MNLIANSKLLIGVIGGRLESTNSQALLLAECAGGELGKRGLPIVCGGEDGIMEAACRGCKQAGGVTIGIMKGNQRKLANPYVDYVILTSMDLARNNIIVWSAAGLLAFDGQYGTLTEIALALDIGKPLVFVGATPLLDTRHVDSPFFAHYEGYSLAKVPDAVDHLLRMIRNQES